MGPVSTGLTETWLIVPTVVLGQLFTLLFIGAIDRVLQRKARGAAGRAIAPAPRRYIDQGSARGEVFSSCRGNEPFTVGGQ